jgi:hypothetical protein
MHRFGTAIISCFVVAACSSDPVVSPAAMLDGVDRVSLLAWRETLGPAYPLTVTGVDSIATITRFVDAANAGWRDTTALPGIPILAAFYAGEDLRAQYGFVETSHGAGGVLVNQIGSRLRIRTATAADISRFLAFFGISVEIRSNTRLTGP